MNSQFASDKQFLKEQMLVRLGPHAKAYPNQIAQRFPHILEKLVCLWGQPEANGYLDSLMVMDRPNRQGFPAEVATEIFQLSMIHGSLSMEPQEDDQGWASSSNFEVSDYFGRRSNR